MTAANFDRALQRTLKWEGHYSDHPKDPGGATQLGITRAVLAEWRGRSVSRDEVKRLTRAEAVQIYRMMYWDRVGCDELPSGLDAAVFDFAVNSGPYRAARMLQNLVGAREDGIVSVDTIRAVKRHAATDLIRRLCDARRGFLGRLGLYAVFGRGWMRRVADIEDFALRLATRMPIPLEAKKETTPMEKTKSVLESRTVWANIVGMAALAASVLGVEVGHIDQSALVDSALKAVAGIGFIASTLFRIGASARLA